MQYMRPGSFKTHMEPTRDPKVHQGTLKGPSRDPQGTPKGPQEDPQGRDPQGTVKGTLGPKTCN